MKKIIIILILSFFVQTKMQAQDAYQNESKYWFYRYRLLTEFLVQGESACGVPNGLNIPCGIGYLPLDSKQQTDENNKPFDINMTFGDGTSFLGYYIGVLATEYKLLRNNSAPQLNKLEKLISEK